MMWQQTYMKKVFEIYHQKNIKINMSDLDGYDFFFKKNLYQRPYKKLNKDTIHRKSKTVIN